MVVKVALFLFAGCKASCDKNIFLGVCVIRVVQIPENVGNILAWGVISFICMKKCSSVNFSPAENRFAFPQSLRTCCERKEGFAWLFTAFGLRPFARVTCCW